MMPEHQVDVSADRMAEMAEMLDDANPIHLDAAAVKALGLGERVINQGPLNCGYIVAMLRSALPGTQLAALSLRLLGHVRDGDRVVAGGRITSAGDDGVIACDVWLDVVGGERAVSGTARLERHAAPA